MLPWDLLQQGFTVFYLFIDIITTNQYSLFWKVVRILDNFVAYASLAYFVIVLDFFSAYLE